MHTRRIATFLLGAWIAGCAFMATVSILSLRAPNIVLSVPHPAAAKMAKDLGNENMEMLLRHAAAEQSRFLLKKWEQVQLGLGVGLAVCLFLGTQRRPLPMLLSVVMLVMVVFQYSGVTTELAYRGKETDFPPGSTALGPMTRYLTLQQVYIGAEIMKYIAGFFLAGFLFAFRTGRRRGGEVQVDDPLKIPLAPSAPHR
ncbi:MAG TPA: hypothetical protein VNX18_23400 [Bryobacteraceae bacterium]|nr:hypothetical protein [Bryobacteraceae bacterium]